MVSDFKFFRLSFVYIFLSLTGVPCSSGLWGRRVVLITGNLDNLKGNFVL